MQQSTYHPLSPEEVLQSRREHGANVLTPPEKEPLWRQFLEKFTDPLIVVLLIAGALSVGISLYEYFALSEGAGVFFEPAGIFVAILLATGLAFYFELQADKEFALLGQVSDDEAVEVIRQGGATQVPRREVVVGDIVMLPAGCEVPADCQLLEATCLSVDESTLTGEPSCHKSTLPQEADPDATYPTDHVMKGTRVAEGHGLARVVAVGDGTEQGRVFEAAQIDNSVRTPLSEQLDGLSALITKTSYVIAGLIVVGRVLMYFVDLQDVPFSLLHFVAYVLQTFMIAVTLIVVSVPEGLPMAVTLSLAFSMRRMLRTNNLVRRMHACETMGACTVICTDKTGTLTENRMTVHELQRWDDRLALPCRGVGMPRPDTPYALRSGSRILHPAHPASSVELLQDDVLLCSLACNSTAELDLTRPERPAVLGNPTEGALLLWLHAQGVDIQALRQRYEHEVELPFSTERKYMASVVREGRTGERLLLVKGAPEIVWKLCRTNAGEAQGMPTPLQDQLQAWQDQAMRTLGFAVAHLREDERGIDLRGDLGRAPGGALVAERLSFLCAAAIADPVRGEVPEAVRECTGAGIMIKIVTGDTPGTAREIGRQIGLWKPEDTDAQIITGPELAALSDEQLERRIMGLKIICRARPMDKKRLVETLQRLGQVVAVTGDGTNDAPALRAAHVGLSMGDGTSVAKEASDITIIDNSFRSIGKAVMWGRSLYQNIQRFLLFQLTVNVTACLLVLCGAFMGTESPLTVTQMLWINLIMDTFAAVALASLPPSRRVMLSKPRERKAFILTGPMLREIVGVGGLFFLMLLALLYVFQHADVRSLSSLLTVRLSERTPVTPYELTLLFTIFVMTHFFYLFCARAFATGRSALHFGGCKGLLTIATIILLGQVAMVETPLLQDFFNVVSLRPDDWLIILVGSSFVLWIRELWVLVARV